VVALAPAADDAHLLVGVLLRHAKPPDAMPWRT